MEVGHEIQQPLGVHRHEVDYFSSCTGATSFVTKKKSLDKKRGRVYYCR